MPRLFSKVEHTNQN